MISSCSSTSHDALLPAQLGPPQCFSRNCLFPLAPAPRSCFLLQLFPAMPQLMYSLALLLLESFYSCPSLPRENACSVDSAGKQSIQPYGCLQGCSDIAYRSSAGNCREKSICRAHTRGDFRDLASPILLQIQRHMPSAATSFALYLNLSTGHYVNTQLAGLENIQPLSCALETWTGRTGRLL